MIRGYELLLPEYNTGYWLGYGVHISNIYWLLLFLVVIKEKILNNLLTFFRKFYFLIMPSALFFLSAFFISNNNSPFIELSTVWLLQYCQLFISALGLIFFYQYKDSDKYFKQVIKASIIMQFFISVWQFFKKSMVGFPFEQWNQGAFYTGLDENNAYFRVQGTMGFHNQLALVVAFMLVSYLPYLFKSNKKDDFLLIIMGLITIVLTQSRSVWLMSLGCLIVFVLFFPKQCKKIRRNYSGYRQKIILYIIAFFLSFIIVPRVLLSLNTFYEGAGLPVRIKMIEEGWEAFIQNPFFGYGVGTNEYVLHSYKPLGLMAVFPAAVHLAYLQLVLEVGWFGLLFLLVPFLYVLRKVFIISKKNLTDFQKLFLFRFVSGLTLFGGYYLFLPHVGVIEAPFLGLVLGAGIIYLEERKKYEKNA